MQAGTAGVHCDEFYSVPCLRYLLLQQEASTSACKNEMKARAWILGSLANPYAFVKEE